MIQGRSSNAGGAEVSTGEERAWGTAGGTAGARSNEWQRRRTAMVTRLTARADRAGDGATRQETMASAMEGAWQPWGKEVDAVRKMARGGHGSSREEVEGELQEGAGASMSTR
jgi:hypothetical protein